MEMLSIFDKIDSSIIARFSAKYSPSDKNVCWEWDSYVGKNGYGTFNLGIYDGKPFIVYAHRVAWVVHNRKAIADGLCVCHICDNRKCVNPHHLFIATQKENIKDMQDKQRWGFGEKSSSAKLSEDDVLEIKKLLNQGIVQRVIAEKYGVTRENISAIKRNKSWRCING